MDPSCGNLAPRCAWHFSKVILHGYILFDKFFDGVFSQFLRVFLTSYKAVSSVSFQNRSVLSSCVLRWQKFFAKSLPIILLQYIGQMIGGDFAKFCGLLRIQWTLPSILSLSIKLNRNSPVRHHMSIFFHFNLASMLAMKW